MAEGLSGISSEALDAATKAATAPPPGTSPQSGGNGISSASLDAASYAAAPADQKQGYLAGLARTIIGQGAMLNWGDEAMALLRHIGTGETYDAALADERAKVASFKKENPKTAVAGQIGGAFLTPGVGMLTGAIKPAASTLGRMSQAAQVGGGFGAAAAAGEATDGNRTQAAVHGGLMGAAIAPAFPLVGSMMSGGARKAADVLGGGIAQRGSADAAADAQMIRALQRGGETPQTIRNQLSEADRVATFYGGGAAKSATPSPMAPVDTSPALQKLAGSVVRSSPEASTQAQSFIAARQTGLPPRTEGGRAAIDGAGIVTRNPLSPKVADAEPAGQYERVRDAMRRAFTLKDTDFHKFGENAYRTEQAMMARLKDEADKLYGGVRTLSAAHDIRPVIEPIVKKYAADAQNLPVGEAAIVRKALRQFTTGNGELVTTVDGFDKAKRVIDSLGEKARNAGDKNTERVLTGIKNDLLKAVDAIKDKDIGKKYAEARGYFSSQMEMKDAIDLGRKAFRENSDVVADQFRDLTVGQQKLFRLGMLESLDTNLGAKSRRFDVTPFFETPRTQELLEATIPRSGKSSAVYADRPERFGDFIANEKQMLTTRDKVLGGSATAERLSDDAAFSRETLSNMVERFRGMPSATNIAIEAASVAVNKVFGYREDVAVALSRRLFTADRAQQEAILQRLEKQWGVDRVSRLVDAINGTMTAVGMGVGANSAPSVAPQPRLPAPAR